MIFSCFSLFRSFFEPQVPGGRSTVLPRCISQNQWFAKTMKSSWLFKIKTFIICARTATQIQNLRKFEAFHEIVEIAASSASWRQTVVAITSAILRYLFILQILFRNIDILLLDQSWMNCVNKINLVVAANIKKCGKEGQMDLYKDIFVAKVCKCVIFFLIRWILCGWNQQGKFLFKQGRMKITENLFVITLLCF